MLSIIKNDWARLMEEKGHLAVSLGLTIFAVILAVLLTNKLEPKLNLAVVGNTQAFPESSAVTVTYKEQAPAKSQLVQGQYDAVITIQDDGSYQIDTIKSDEFKNKLEAILMGDQNAQMESQASQRQIGTNICGYMLMFLLMQGILYMRAFAEDKEKHQIERVVCAPVPFRKYLAGHVIFSWMLIFIPTFLMIAVLDLVGISIGFALWQYAILIALISLLSTCFAVCINAFFCVADTANMLGSTIIVLTSILAGSFYDCGTKGSLMNRFLYILPQKNLMNFFNAWEKHLLNPNKLLGIFYVIILSVVLLWIGVAKTRRDYIYHK